MNWNKWIRQTHRWLSIAFTVTVIANIVALAQGEGCLRLGDLLAAAPARLALVHRSVLVRAAVCRQVAQRATHRCVSLSVGVNAMANKTSRKSAPPKKAAARQGGGSPGSRPPCLLSGGNPQIAKADGDAPVQAYIAAMPGWKRDVGRRLDALIVRTVPGVRKAVRWNSPLLWRRGPGLVPRLPLHHEVRQGGFLPRRVAASSPARRVQAEGRALPRHPRGRPARRSSARAWVKQASECRAKNVIDRRRKGTMKKTRERSKGRHPLLS